VSKSRHCVEISTLCRNLPASKVANFFAMSAEATYLPLRVSVLKKRLWLHMDQAMRDAEKSPQMRNFFFKYCEKFDLGLAFRERLSSLIFAALERGKLSFTYDELLLLAVDNGCIKLMLKLIERYKPTTETILKDQDLLCVEGLPNIAGSVLTCACRRGNFEVVRQLIERFEIEPSALLDRGTIFLAAFKSSNGLLLDWLINFAKPSLRFIVKKVLFRLTEDFSFDTFVWLISKLAISREDLFRSDYFLLRRMCSCGRLDGVKWLLERFELGDDAAIKKRMLIISCFSENVELAQYLVEKFGFDFETLRCQLAEGFEEREKLAMLTWAENFSVFHETSCGNTSPANTAS